MVVSEPGGDYCTHVTPEHGTGVAIASELVVRERGVLFRVLEIDGCSVNCGIHIGVFRLVSWSLATQYSTVCVSFISMNWA